MLYGNVLKKLKEKEIKYLVCGGTAATIYGVERTSMDLDLVVELEKNNLDKLEDALHEVGFRELHPIKLSVLADETQKKFLKDEKNMIVFTFYERKTGEQRIDIMYDIPLSFEEMWRDRNERKHGDIDLIMVSVDHLIKMKEYASRPKDLFDVVELKRLFHK